MFDVFLVITIILGVIVLTLPTVIPMYLFATKNKRAAKKKQRKELDRAYLSMLFVRDNYFDELNRNGKPFRQFGSTPKKRAFFEPKIKDVVLRSGSDNVTWDGGNFSTEQAKNLRFMLYFNKKFKNAENIVSRLILLNSKDDIIYDYTFTIAMPKGEYRIYWNINCATEAGAYRAVFVLAGECVSEYYFSVYKHDPVIEEREIKRVNKENVRKKKKKLFYFPGFATLMIIPTITGIISANNGENIAFLALQIPFSLIVMLIGISKIGFFSSLKVNSFRTIIGTFLGIMLGLFLRMFGGIIVLYLLVKYFLDGDIVDQEDDDSEYSKLLYHDGKVETIYKTGFGNDYSKPGENGVRYRKDPVSPSRMRKFEGSNDDFTDGGMSL